MTTKSGTSKKTPLSAFSNVRVTGIIAISLHDNDSLISAQLTDGECDIIIGSRLGNACRFHESDVRPMGRTAAGVRGIRLSEEDEVVSMAVIRRNDSNIIVVSDKGYGKRNRVEDFRLTKRGGKGVISMNLTPKTGNVVSLMEVFDTDDLVIMTENGVLIRQPVKDIRVIGRNTQGVKLIRLGANDSIADITSVSHEDSDDDNEQNEMPENGTPANGEASQESLF
jgi:DNA gyrase subunit A